MMYDVYWWYYIEVRDREKVENQGIGTVEIRTAVENDEKK